MKRERILSLFLVLVLVFQTGGITSKAYVLNGYKITTPTSIPIYCDSAANASRINTYAKKWNACSEVYLYVGNSASAYIHSTVTNESTGAYGITYHHSNNNHSIVFYHSWETTTDSKKNETIVHEVGHALGLAHTQSANVNRSVMRATGFNGIANPLSDDRTGITALY